MFKIVRKKENFSLSEPYKSETYIEIKNEKYILKFSIIELKPEHTITYPKILKLHQIKVFEPGKGKGSQIINKLKKLNIPIIAEVLYERPFNFYLKNGFEQESWDTFLWEPDN